MLKLMNGEQFVKDVVAGARFSLPSGDVVSPAYAGWESGDYMLVQPPPEPPTAPAAPTQAAQEANRRSAYQQEADPLFFMSQRGEATTAEWEAKVAEIKARYPYPEA
jgi:hypothetical protein